MFECAGNKKLYVCHVWTCFCASGSVKMGDNMVSHQSRQCTLKPSASTRQIVLRHSFVVFPRVGRGVCKESFITDETLIFWIF